MPSKPIRSLLARLIGVLFNTGIGSPPPITTVSSVSKNTKVKLSVLRLKNMEPFRVTVLLILLR